MSLIPRKVMARLVGAFAVLSTFGVAADSSSLQPGVYEVATELELPHLTQLGAQKTDTVCITESGTRGIVPLSANNPVARCPASNVKEEAGVLSFDLVCDGYNQASASAKFQLGPDRFTGAFKMKMGGKNMTMTERQTGRRIRACGNS